MGSDPPPFISFYYYYTNFSPAIGQLWRLYLPIVLRDLPGKAGEQGLDTVPQPFEVWDDNWGVPFGFAQGRLFGD